MQFNSAGFFNRSVSPALRGHHKKHHALLNFSADKLYAIKGLRFFQKRDSVIARSSGDEAIPY